MTGPKVSVVTTVFNGAPYVDRAIPSILGQSFRDFEWIIVDDGSTDRTHAILQELSQQEPRVRVLTPGRLGFVRALNHGVSVARGDYIARQDFDDRSDRLRLELQVALLDSDPGLGVVGGSFVIVDENRGERYVRILPTEHDRIASAMAKSIVFAHTTTMFRRQAWSDVGGYPLVPDVEDHLMWLRLARGGWRFGAVPEVIGEHYVHPASFFHRTFRYADRQRKLARAQARAIREFGLPAWMYVYVLGRYVYAYAPSGMKRAIRRRVAVWRERDV